MKNILSIAVVLLVCGSCHAQKKGTSQQKPVILKQDFDPQSILVKGVVVAILPVDTAQKQYPLNKYPSKAVIKILSIGRKGRSYAGNLPNKINQEVTMFFPMTTRATRTLFNKNELKTKALFNGLAVGQKISVEAVDTQEALDDLAIPKVIAYE